jgi:hypothetical protein
LAFGSEVFWSVLFLRFFGCKCGIYDENLYLCGVIGKMGEKGAVFVDFGL